ncbi:MAG: zincin-like metallopeptidase domain-containing protein, partial [bacterium]|nr:zincin-like metallopeptidase domain-containing protein [bacterium]
VVPWQKPWHAKVGAPRNGVSGRYYRGLNVFLLSHAGFESPWWFSPKQVNDLGGHIIKGEKVSWCHFFKPWLPKSDQADPLEVEADEADGSTRRPIWIIRAYRVVNLDQCAGPGIGTFREKHPPVQGPVKDNDPIAACEEIVAAMPDPPSVRHGGNRACYWPAVDQIRMPRRETFVGSEEYYSTLFHELTHSTGHADRLNRKTLVAGAPFRSPVYSQEELVAEMGAAFLCAEAGIDDPTIENSAAYLGGWLTYLSSDPKALVVAGAQAQKAADHILGRAGVEEAEGGAGQPAAAAA